MSPHDQLAYAGVCILLLVLFLDFLGTAIFLMLIARVPPKPIKECPWSANPLAWADCSVCGGDPGNCPAFVLNATTAEISKGAIAALATKKESTTSLFDLPSNGSTLP